MRIVISILLTIVGILTICVGVAFIYWPAALIVGGICSVGIGLTIDTSTPVRIDKPDTLADDDAADAGTIARVYG